MVQITFPRLLLLLLINSCTHSITMRLILFDQPRRPMMILRMIARLIALLLMIPLQLSTLLVTPLQINLFLPPKFHLKPALTKLPILIR